MRRKAFIWVLATLWLCVGGSALAQGTVRFVLNRDNVNIRLLPALGAEVIAFANAGTTFVADARSQDSEWLRINFAGEEAWIGVAVVSVLQGDIDSLPVRDPRFIPYRGFESPRSGFTDADSEIRGRLAESGLRVRSGPGRAYIVLADAPRFTVLPLLGRTADNAWLQVNFEGTLGWVATRFVEIQDNRNILELPVDGIVASDPPFDFESEEELVGILRFMRERLDLAQISLDTQRAAWTDAALGNAPFCGGYPSRPTGFNIPRRTYQRYFNTLDPLIVDFNDAMTNIRNAIELQIDVCDRPQASVVLTSTPVVTGGLDLVNAADRQVALLRQRIDELLPEFGPDDCIFQFQGYIDVLRLIRQQEIIVDNFDEGNLVTGYCVDANELDTLRVELLRDGSNYDVLIAVSPLNNPTDFLGSATGDPSENENLTIINNIPIPLTGRYLIIVSIEPPDDEFAEGDFALYVNNTFGSQQFGASLGVDEEGNITLNEPDLGGDIVSGGGTGAEVIGPAQPQQATNVQTAAINVRDRPDVSGASVGALQPGETVPIVAVEVGWVQVQLPSGATGWVQRDLVSVTNQDTTPPTTTTTTTESSGTLTTDGTCPGVTLTCDEIFTCSAVQACVDAGSTSLNPNGNNLACDADEAPDLSCSVSVP